MGEPVSLAEIPGRTKPDRVRLVADIELPFDVAWALLGAIKAAAERRENGLGEG